MHSVVRILALRARFVGSRARRNNLGLLQRETFIGSPHSESGLVDPRELYGQSVPAGLVVAHAAGPTPGYETRSCLVETLDHMHGRQSGRKFGPSLPLFLTLCRFSSIHHQPSGEASTRPRSARHCHGAVCRLRLGHGTPRRDMLLLLLPRGCQLLTVT